MAEMSKPLAAYDFYRGPERLGTMWTMKRAPLTLTCTLATHRLGWELRLAAGSSFSRSEVCKTQQAVFDTSDAWQAEARAKGWTD